MTVDAVQTRRRLSVAVVQFRFQWVAAVTVTPIRDLVAVGSVRQQLRRIAAVFATDRSVQLVVVAAIRRHLRLVAVATPVAELGALTAVRGADGLVNTDWFARGRRGAVSAVVRPSGKRRRQRRGGSGPAVGMVTRYEAV